MPRIRTLKREFFESETVARLPLRARLTFAGLICVEADDEGRLRDDPKLIKAAIWPQDEHITRTDVEEDLTLLNTVEITGEDFGLIVRYERKGLKLIQIRSWKEHQRISHPTKSKYPSPPRVSRNFAKTPELFGLEVEVGSGLEEEVGSRTRARKVARRSANNGGAHAHKANGTADPQHVAEILEETKRDLAMKRQQ